MLFSLKELYKLLENSLVCPIDLKLYIHMHLFMLVFLYFSDSKMSPGSHCHKRPHFLRRFHKAQWLQFSCSCMYLGSYWGSHSFWRASSFGNGKLLGVSDKISKICGKLLLSLVFYICLQLVDVI